MNSILALVLGCSLHLNAHVLDERAAVCTGDNKIVVTIPKKREFYEVTHIHYGTCTKQSGGVEIWSETAGIQITLDIEKCDMTGAELTDQGYHHTGKINLGVFAQGQTLIIQTWTLNVHCVYDGMNLDGSDDTLITYEYGTNGTNPSDTLPDYSDPHVVPNYKVERYTDENYTYVVPEDEVYRYNRAGTMIYLTLGVADSNFPHETMKFAPIKCQFCDMDKLHMYQMFDADSGQSCHDDAINFKMTFDPAHHEWRIEHVLFLMDTHSFSSYELRCWISLCNLDDDSKCNNMARKCLDSGNVEEFTELHADAHGHGH